MSGNTRFMPAIAKNTWVKARWARAALHGLACAGLLMLTSGCASSSAPRMAVGQPMRHGIWVNTLRSEPMTLNALLDELQTARVVYLGEFHRIGRHHDLQLELLNGLANRGVPLVLAMEQFEYFTQPVLDKYNAGEVDLPALVAESEWNVRWRGHEAYHDLLKAARAHDVPVLALNARAETVRAIGRQSLSGITPEQRDELPPDIMINDPLYEQLMTRVLGVHMAFDPGRLRPVFEAQVARDEMMAWRLSDYLQSPEGANRMALVICGRGHCEFGLGIPDRIANRMPGLVQRVVLFSQSGDLQLTEEERRQAREIEIPHQFLRDLGRVPADFTHIAELAPIAP